MKTSFKVLFAALAALALNACATLNVREIKNLDRVAFAPLRLDPDVEPADLRVDVIRQTTQVGTGQNTRTVAVAYDPMGFNLGNGLFYDLNANFALRLDHLLGFADEDSFTLSKATANSFLSNGLEVYSLANDSLTLTRNGRRRSRPQYHTEGPADSLTYRRKNNFKYVIAERDSALVLRNRRREKQTIVMEDENHYHVQRWLWKEDFSQQSNEITLHNRYLVALSTDQKTMTVYRLRRRGRRTPLRTIVRSQNKLFVYARNYRGLALEFDDRTMTIYNNKTLLSRYELEIPKKARSTGTTP